jgi:hypothetical protein
MSTKTTFKRIALVAVAALGFGMLSVVSASATEGNITQATGFTITDSGTTTTKVTTTVGANNFIGFTLTTVAGTSYAVNTTGGTVSGSAANTDIVSGNNTASMLISASTTSQALTVPTPVIGTITVRVFKFTAGVQGSSSISSLTITVTAAPIAAGTINVAASTSFITDSATVLSNSLVTAASNARTAALTADATVGASRTAATNLGTSTPVALIKVTLMDTQLVSAAISGRDLTAVITGPGLLVGTGAGSTDLLAPAASSVTSRTDSNGIAVFAVYAAGVGGVSTIEISSTSATTNVKTVVATETLTLHGGVAKITPTVRSGNIANSGAAFPTGTLSSTNHVFRLTLTDSDGYAVRSSTTITATPADTALVSAVTCGSSPSSTGRVYCTATAVAGKTGKTTN